MLSRTYNRPPQEASEVGFWHCGQPTCAKVLSGEPSTADKTLTLLLAREQTRRSPFGANATSLHSVAQVNLLTREPLRSNKVRPLTRWKSITKMCFPSGEKRRDWQSRMPLNAPRGANERKQSPPSRGNKRTVRESGVRPHTPIATIVCVASTDVTDLTSLSMTKNRTNSPNTVTSCTRLFVSSAMRRLPSSGAKHSLAGSDNWRRPEPREPMEHKHLPSDTRYSRTLWEFQLPTAIVSPLGCTAMPVLNALYSVSIVLIRVPVIGRPNCDAVKRK